MKKPKNRKPSHALIFIKILLSNRIVSHSIALFAQNEIFGLL